MVNIGKKIAIYPGSFDPFHNGHLNILNKALKLFDFVYIVITKNINKNENPDLESRVNKIQLMISDLDNTKILINKDYLTIDFAKKVNAGFIVRGVRDTETFQNEIEFIDANKSLNSNIETILLVSDLNERKLSSSIIREIEFYKNNNK
ncbi:pantetheine-phosphate adenylyltransferase [Spiroplasma turonicum]|uniref:Phosphopantetheine adenylyltransferase n=1 Tax=Spiroplasma turonicum TaxID=216946 RepID=A0A0K1P4Z4_9MOLU|nr:pantetheine-phosphate adenylyltransferase [Spiroplasma turonicum]AKU79381.1 phosphopantetheine adenylyltransferase [Spiroplasma turonicum]ALX70403.1 phosphopantetheine adenylyltransferase [Spiroplasma turonicum]